MAKFNATRWRNATPESRRLTIRSARIALKEVADRPSYLIYLDDLRSAARHLIKLLEWEDGDEEDAKR